MKSYWLIRVLAAISLLSQPLGRAMADEGDREGRKDGEVRKEGEEGRRPPPPRREGEERDRPRDGEFRREGGPRPDGEERREPRPPGPPEGRPEGREGDFRGPPMGPPMGPPGPPRDGRPGEHRGPPMHDLEHLKQHDPELYELTQKDMEMERQAAEFAQRAHRASKQDREKMRETAQALSTEHFNLRQLRRKLQLKRMEEELVKLKESVEAREKQKSEIIARRVAEMLGEESDLGF